MYKTNLLNTCLDKMMILELIYTPSFMAGINFKKNWTLAQNKTSVSVWGYIPLGLTLIRPDINDGVSVFYLVLER